MHSMLSVKFTSLSLNSQTCTSKFAKNKNTIKETWDGIKTIITSTRSINPEIPQLKFNGLIIDNLTFIVDPNIGEIFLNPQFLPKVYFKDHN